MTSPSRPSSLWIKDGALAGDGAAVSAAIPARGIGLSAPACGTEFVIEGLTAGAAGLKDFAGAAVEGESLDSWRSAAPDFVPPDAGDGGVEDCSAANIR
jgi:hypothetical protein